MSISREIPCIIMADCLDSAKSFLPSKGSVIYNLICVSKIYFKFEKGDRDEHFNSQKFKSWLWRSCHF